jgi:hypothetical protein
MFVMPFWHQPFNQITICGKDMEDDIKLNSM